MHSYVLNFPPDSWNNFSSLVCPKLFGHVILKSFERIGLQKFTDILQHICDGLSVPKTFLKIKKKSFTMKKLSLVKFSDFQYFWASMNFYFSSCLLFPKTYDPPSL